jgi:hypothetical protein
MGGKKQVGIKKGKKICLEESNRSKEGKNNRNG